MKTVEPFSEYENIVKTLQGQGGFLAVKSRTEKLNIMTIGWLTLGIVWRKPILMIAVRESRYTFQLIENSDDFTVAIPFSDMNKQLIFCGTRSGVQVDKFKECDLVAVPAQKVKTPTISLKNARHYECKIVQATPMDKKRLNPQYDADIYQDRAYHTYYFGEIMACYET